MTRTSPAELLLRARQAAGMSQRELARLANTTQSVIARIENGQTIPGWDTLNDLLRAAGFDVQVELVQRPRVDRETLLEARRILALSPTDRIREVANVSRFIANTRRVRDSSSI